MVFIPAESEAAKMVELYFMLSVSVGLKVSKEKL